MDWYKKKENKWISIFFYSFLNHHRYNIHIQEQALKHYIGQVTAQVWTLYYNDKLEVAEEEEL